MEKDPTEYTGIESEIASKVFILIIINLKIHFLFSRLNKKIMIGFQLTKLFA